MPNISNKEEVVLSDDLARKEYDKIRRKIALIRYLLVIIIFLVFLIYGGFIQDVIELCARKISEGKGISQKNLQKGLAAMFIPVGAYVIRYIFTTGVKSEIEFLSCKDESSKKDIIAKANIVSDIKKIERELKNNGNIKTDKIEELKNNANKYDYLNIIKTLGIGLMISSIPFSFLFLQWAVDSSSSKQIYIGAQSLSSGMTDIQPKDEKFQNAFILFAAKDSTLRAESREFDLAQMEYLRAFVNSFGSCATDSTENVKLEVTGYASNPGTNKLNFDLANNRARYITSRILELIKREEFEGYKNGIDVAPKIWQTVDQMKVEKGVTEAGQKLEKTKAIKNSTAEILNRRVDIKVISLGACE